MKLLVTGVAGFIAARTAEMLLGEGHEVVGVDNLNDYYDVRLKTYRLRELARAAGADAALLDRFDLLQAGASEYHGPDRFRAGRFTFTRLDIEQKAAIAGLFDEHRFDAVLNLAARAGVRYSMIDPDVYMTTNAMGTLHLMDAMRGQGCRKLVLASTSSLYAGQAMPFREDLPVNTPISPYAASKKAAEVLAYSYHYLYELDVSVVRYFTVFGPAGRPDMSIFRFIKWMDEGKPIELFGDGSQSRDFTYVDDIARGTIAAVAPVGYEIINLGGGNNPISINEVIAFLESALGKKAVLDRRPFHRADMKETYADIAKAARLFGWSPEVSPYDGFARTVRWYRENAAWLGQVVV
ncbi:MAG: NAD-dependent epimerase/dehydratase family protein [Thermoguttaceae bacterium]